jgi:hypothetical protein
VLIGRPPHKERLRRELIASIGFDEISRQRCIFFERRTQGRPPLNFVKGAKKRFRAEGMEATGEVF